MMSTIGHTSWRGLACIVSAALCIAGIAQFSMAAIVPVKAMAAQLLLEHAFDRSVALHRRHKPWPWADMAPVARVRVPRLGVDQVVIDTGSGQAMAFGPTLLPGSAPLGEPGTAVIAAHRDTHFRFLKNVRIGDVIDIETVEGTLRHYRVERAEIVRWDRFVLGDGSSAGSIALATCYPFDTFDHGPLRYVVHAEPVASLL